MTFSDALPVLSKKLMMDTPRLLSQNNRLARETKTLGEWLETRVCEQLHSAAIVMDWLVLTTLLATWTMAIGQGTNHVIIWSREGVQEYRTG